MEHFDVVVVGAGIAGLSAAELLARKGKEVLVLEKKQKISKPCAGGLTLKCSGHIPDEQIECSFDHLKFNTPWYSLNVNLGQHHISMIKREDLSEWMIDKAVDAGAEIRMNTRVTGIYDDHVTVNGSTIRFNHLIGADGSLSLVRKFLGLPVKKVIRTVQYKSPTPVEELAVFVDLNNLGVGYGWVFPHQGFTSIGAGGDSGLINVSGLRRYLDTLCSRLDLEMQNFVAAPINYDYQGFKFGNIYLAGDAAGLAFGLTGEGIYQAIISGKEVARVILNKYYQYPELKSLLKIKRNQERMLTLLGFSRRGTEYLIKNIIPHLYKYRNLGKRFNDTFGLV